MPSLNHEDVRLDNLFLTEPITIFDPNPKLEHPLADLAATELYLLLENKISSDKKEFRKENLRKGYEEITQKKIDKNIFNACLVIRILQKMRLHHMREKKQRVQDELKILDQIQLA
jgi:fructosamine-3-kinase